MLDFIYYPVSWIMWVWHKVFGFVLGDDNGFAWALSVVFLVFTLRVLLYKPFVVQVRSMRKMQEMAPEMQKLRKKYANDRQKLATEMQKLQQQNGANPLMGCLPILVQIPVFIGLFHVLREFKPGKTENYVFNAAENASFVDSSLFGAKLGSAVWPLQNTASVAELGGNLVSQWIVMIPLMIAAGIFTHITARHSVARQQAQIAAGTVAANPQAEIMQKLMLYVFPIGVVVGAPFLPLAVLFYWVANNLWTLGQQYVVYRKIDAEESDKAEKATESAKARAPRPGQKPIRDARRGTAEEVREIADEPIGPAEEKAAEAASQARATGSDGASADTGTTSDGQRNGAARNGNGNGNGQKKPGAKPVQKRPGAKARRGKRR
ncbi:Inner membrane protein translocase component YidC, long form [Pseudonocardia sp. Ae406_Ps2]|uniref:membrane protein insertase YidC n=1 Tax=unclassified Pseudonocardia TaxID=2619320 RepID=UPI00094B2414|nr:MULTISPECIES: membrane protein insertase YidC [unclassified Pseudonocardia]OLL98463.1 Inner membrane protein translocase component YidC, long form [Pseudonocardia sp. Ae331_Ps2]OLM03810.1 Inner membrane protein translocase component YidC, long form [Pseudonocardia sp. Ae406_Ps2]OLM11337.1 Inner membrane protein translocase component YidC, long form [Pseudonocardia sp. Ae505_Ps2]OLM25367.1 Inner membrane protein translocase component YidC, long form [Pseudonocardia sp. Ae706_Ps2]OLM34444.1 I